MSRSNGTTPNRVDRLPRRESEPMVYLTLVKRSWRWFRHWVWTLIDALPPYQIVEGALEDKGVDSTGRPYILLGGDRIEIDTGTLDALEVGEMLKVRHTKGNRAVNIDRILPPDNESE